MGPVRVHSQPHSVKGLIMQTPTPPSTGVLHFLKVTYFRAWHAENLFASTVTREDWRSARYVTVQA